MKEALIIGGSNGIGLSIVTQLKGYDVIHIVDKVEPAITLPSHIHYYQFDLTMPDYSFFDQFGNISLLMITAGFGKLALFEDLNEDYIVNSFHVNTVSAIRLIHHFYDKLKGQEDFFCGVMVSIAGFMSSPFFSVYGATKAALKIFIESVNVELEMAGSPNRILNVSPGSIPGTRFNGSDNDLSLTQELAQEIISHMVAKDDLFIPKYEEVYREVLARYQKDFRAEGRHSYEYKLKSGRLNRK
jgi:short-subunit dehydrogenase